VIEPLVDAVVDGAVREEAGEATAAGVQESPLAAHVEVGLVLAGEAHARQIFCGSGTAHGDGQLRAVLRAQVVRR
jgi:hypothetical protein